ncbi:cytochrome P450 [Cubamyces sp. BRFM 1775]|nr:cytochrome P450 [Cubamyces sp. BRFM 1775]
MLWHLIQSSHALWVALLSVLVLRYLRSLIDLRARRRGLPLPPGPTRWPFLGNLFNAPSSWKPWLGYQELIAKFGEVVYLEVLGRSMIILGSADVMNEFLEKRSALTADRPPSPLSYLVGQEDNIGFLRYGPRWRHLRRGFWQHFHSGVIPKCHPMQESIAHKALARFLDPTSDVKEVVHYAFGGAILKYVYGVEAKDEKDARVIALDAAFDGVREITAPVQLVLEMLPFLSRLPTWTPSLGPLIAKLDKSKATHQRNAIEQYNHTKGMVARGEDDTSMVAKLLAAMARSESSDEEKTTVIPVAAVAAEGQSDLTTSTAEGFLLAMSLYPEVQKKARAELDTVVGPDRLPTFSDRESLVYVNAILKEALRWHNVAPLGVVHMTTEDAELRGNFVPAGTIIAPNMWACMHNPETYPEPDTFNPDRFIQNGRLRDDVLDPASIIFGFGRRCCPGRHFADAMLYIIIATMLHVFDISPPLDEHGRPITITFEQSHGFISFPEDSRCTVKPRPARAELLLRESYANDI